jgi:signal transduction histidine kinase
MPLIVIISILLFLSLFLVVIFLLLILRTKKQLKNMAEALTDIQTGNGNRKILAVDNDIISVLSFKMNEIVYGYEEQLSQLRSADETNRQLMTNLSHDVRTPLTTLIGYLDAIHRGVAGPDEHDEYIEIARLKAHDLKDYIDILFDWFKLNSCEFSLSLEQTELAELTRNILKDWIPIFEERQLLYEIKIPEKPMFVTLDSGGYERIMNNLIQNVISHSNASQITIEITPKETDSLIRIEDNGIGIDKSDLLHIFERLYKCDKGRSGKGSGLGLSIVKQMVEKMNGTIYAESEPSQYTAFTVSFPAKH